jgi:type I restriction enzyme R subunit
VRRSPDRALEQVSDPVLQDPVGRPADRIADALNFEVFVHLGAAERRVAPEIEALHAAPVTSDHGFQHRTPAISAVHIARPQDAPLDIAKLVEHEQRLVTGTVEMAIVGAAFLLTAGRAFARIQVERGPRRRSPVVHLVDPMAGQIGERCKVLGPAEPLRLKPAHPARRGFSDDAAVEGPAVALFQVFGWNRTNLYQETFGTTGTEGRATMRELVLPNRLWEALQKLNPHLSTDALRDAAAEITRGRSAMLATDANAEVYRLFRDRVQVQVRGEDGERKTEIARIIDWRNPGANDFLLAQQVRFQGELYKRRADLVGFVNGIPLLLIELKGPGENVKQAFDNNIRSYRNDIPQLFVYNAAVIVSNGIETKVGATYASYEHFIEWKKAESEDEPPTVGLEVAIRGVGHPERLLDLVENFVAYEKVKGGLDKKLAKNHQFLGVNRAVAAVDRIAETRGRLGVFWHTQGSGKSLSMLYFAQKILRTKAGNWTFVIVTDRVELDDQIAGTFAACGAITKERDEVQAQTREHLKELLQGNERYIFTLIHKFGTAQGETFPQLSDRRDIIVITDEAHRSQYAVLAANMRRALPNAAFISITGTPLIATDAEKTKEVFGDYVSIYDFAQSIEDGATVPLYYENRIPELQLANEDLSDDLDQLIEEAALDEAQEAQLAQVFSRQYHLITREDRLDRIAEDVVRHFAGRGYRGKAMYIAIDKVTALRMHDKVRTRWNAEITRLETALTGVSGEERAAQEAKIAWMKATDMAVVVSPGQNEQADMAAKGLDIAPHRRRMNDDKMDVKFKDPDDPFRLVFLCAMWLTGFDAPSCSTIYLDKPMKNHTLMQTIARANRVCGDKEAGLIVDYVGVLRNLQRALAIYARGTGSGELPIKDKAALLAELQKPLNAVLTFAARRQTPSDFQYVRHGPPEGTRRRDRCACPHRCAEADVSPSRSPGVEALQGGAAGPARRAIYGRHRRTARTGRAASLIDAAS